MSRIRPTNALCHDGPDRRGFTLVELVVSVAIMSGLLIGMGSAVMIATRSIDTGGGHLAETLAAREIVDEITRDVHFATSFITRTDTEVVFMVPDRDGVGGGELIKYKWFGTPGGPAGPLRRRYNNGAPVTLADNVTNFNFSYLYRPLTGVPPGSGGLPGLLLVVVDAGNLTTQEADKKALIESWGHVVSLISASDAQVDFDTAAMRADVAYVVEQGQSTVLGTKLRSAALGVVNEEVELRDKFGFSADRGWPAPTDALSIIDNSHYITSPFSAGLLTICSSSQNVVNLAGTVAGGLTVLGEFNNGGPQPGVSVIETAEDLYGGGTAAGRRVQMPWGHAGFDINALTADGQTLMKRAIDWAAGNEGPGAATAILGFDTAFPTPVSNVADIQIATLVTLPEDGNVSSISAYVGDSNMGVRYAIYTDSGGEPDELVVESASQATAIADDWVMKPVSSTALSAGNYWLALSLDQIAHRYYWDSGGQTRYKNYDAETSGYLPIWGTSDNSYAIKISIYAAYTPE